MWLINDVNVIGQSRSVNGVAMPGVNSTREVQPVEFVKPWLNGDDGNDYPLVLDDSYDAVHDTRRRTVRVGDTLIHDVHQEGSGRTERTIIDGGPHDAMEPIGNVSRAVYQDGRVVYPFNHGGLSGDDVMNIGTGSFGPLSLNGYQLLII